MFSRTLSVRASITPRSLLSKADSSAALPLLASLTFSRTLVRHRSHHAACCPWIRVRWCCRCYVLMFSRTPPSGHDHTTQLVVQGGFSALVLPPLASLMFSRTPPSGRRSHHAACCPRRTERCVAAVGVLDVLTNALRQGIDHTTQLLSKADSCAGVAVGVLDVLTNASVRASITPRSLLSKADRRGCCRCWRLDVLTNALVRASITPRSLLSKVDSSALVLPLFVF